MHRGRNNDKYTLDFQVWRPFPTLDDSTGIGCYSLVGNNTFTSVSPNNGLVTVTPSSSQYYINFQPGDVLGFYVKDAKEYDYGIVVRSESDEVVWHASIDPNEIETTRLKEGCPYPWPTESDELSIVLTHAAPIISISTSKLLT